MKKILLSFVLLVSTSSFACMCDFDFDNSKVFKSPGIDESVESIVKNKLGLSVKYNTEVSYSQTFMELFLGDPRSNSCLGESADGKTTHACIQKYTGVRKAFVEEQNCDVLVKVKRRKKKTTTKILSHNCTL